jgi:hypothetical protein
MTEGGEVGRAQRRVAISAKNGDLLALQATDARFQSSGVPFQGGGGAKSDVPSRDSSGVVAIRLWYATFPLGENKVKQNKEWRFDWASVVMHVWVRAVHAW